MTSIYQRKSGRWDATGRINGQRRHFQAATPELAEQRFELAYNSETFIPNQSPVEVDLPQPRRWREAGLDLETTNLNANFGQIIVACLKPVGESVITLRLDDVLAKHPGAKPWDDTALLLELLPLLNQCGKIFGWYSSEFDIKYLRTRKLLDNIQPPCTFAHADLWKVAKSRFALHNNRLDTYSRSLAPADHQKTPIDWECWRRAAFGDKQSMDYVAKHCQEDVTAMEFSFLHLDPFITSWTQEVL